MNWIPLIQNDEILKYKLKLDQIYDVLCKTDYTNNITFLSGKMGICMFVSYYAIYNDNDEIRDIARSLFKDIENEISTIKIENYYDFIQFSEFGWFALQMYENGLVEMDPSVYFTELDELLHPAVSILMSNDKYVCLNGAINIGLYFLTRYKHDKSVLKYILNFVELLKNRSINKNEKVFWESVINVDTYERGVNMGIAHGVPGIILYLTKLLENGIVSDNIRLLLSGACNFILSAEQDFQKYHSYFTGVLVENKVEVKGTRIAWCYGDLGIAYSLLKVSQLDIYNKEVINDYANKYLYSTIERSLHGYTGITDASLCHGAMGAAHIYNRINQTLSSYDQDILVEKSFDIIVDIKNIIIKEYNSSNSYPIGLMWGKLGELLFLLQFYEFIRDEEIIEYIILQLGNIIDDTDVLNTNYSFAYGLSGIGWFVDVINRKGYLDSGSEDIFSEIDEMIFEQSKVDLLSGNYDFFSNAIGAALYFIKKKSIPISFIIDYLNIIDELKINKDNGYCIYEDRNREYVNFGLAHGLPSIIAFLISAYNKNIHKDLCIDLISGFSRYLINQKNQIQKCNSFFPYSSLEHNVSSRLAWCYGDLSIGYLFKVISHDLGLNDFRPDADNILLHCSNRFNLKENMVDDACLCHGSAGIEYILKKIHRKFNLPNCDIAANYWYSRTIDFHNKEGYLFKYNGNFMLVRGFLEGISGVGISLISGLLIDDSVWDESLLLS